jgi:DNA-binding transcriptional regulator YiaG
MMTNNEIKVLRNELGLTQAKFAELLGVTPVAISRWESGRVKPTNSNVKHMQMLMSKRKGA